MDIAKCDGTGHPLTISSSRSNIGEGDGVSPKWEDGINKYLQNRMLLSCGDTTKLQNKKLMVQVWGVNLI